MCLNPQETADLFTFAEEILNGKLHFLSNVFGWCEAHIWFALFENFNIFDSYLQLYMAEGNLFL